MKMKKWLLLGGLCAIIPAGLWADPGENIHIGNLTLSPFAELSGTYDSNVRLVKYNREDDYFGDLVGGLAFINRTDPLILRGRGWLQLRRYLDATDKDSDGFGEKLGLIWGSRDKLALEINESFTQLEDYEITPRSVDTLNLTSQALMLTEDRTERVKRHLFDIAGLLGRRTTEKIELDAGYGFSMVRYLETDLYDWDENRGRVEGGYRLTDKTMVLVNGEVSFQDSDGFENTPELYVVRGGLLTRTTDKTTLRAEGGLERYDFGARSAEGDDLDKTIFSYMLAGTWQATEKLYFEITGRNAIQPATQYKANTKEIALAALGGAYQWTPTIKMSLAGSFRRDDYIGRIRIGDELKTKRRQHLGGRLRLEYKPRAKFYDIFAETTYEDVDDNLEDDYENYFQWRVSLGLSLRY